MDTPPPFKKFDYKLFALRLVFLWCSLFIATKLETYICEVQEVEEPGNWFDCLMLAFFIVLYFQKPKQILKDVVFKKSH